MPPIVLTTLKFLFIALLYLFIARAIRVIYLDRVGPRVRKQQQQARPSGRRAKGTPRSVRVREPERMCPPTVGNLLDLVIPDEAPGR